MAECVQPPLRLDDRLACRGKDHTRGAQAEGDNSLHYRSGSHCARRLVAGSSHHRRAGPQACGLGGLPGHHAGDGRPFVGGWHPGRFNLQSSQHGPRPISPAEVKKQGARAPRLVDGVLACQPEAHIVLGQQDATDAVIQLWLLVSDPQDLGCRETGQGVVAGDLDKTLSTQALADLVAFRRSALVIPQDRRSQDLIVGVEKHQPVHLPRQTHTHDLFRIHLRPVQYPANAADSRLPPQVGMLLGPHGPGCLVGIFRGSHPHDLTIRPDHDSLGGRRRRIDSQEEAHSGHSPVVNPRSSTNSWTSV